MDIPRLGWPGDPGRAADPAFGQQPPGNTMRRTLEWRNLVSEPAPDGYASDPTLEMLWTTVPAYTGATVSSSAAGPAPSATMVPITVSLATVHNAESAMLSEVSEIVNAYNTQNQAVQSEIAQGTIFGQQARFTATGKFQPNTYVYRDPGQDVYIDGPLTGLQQSAQDFAAHINPAMTRVLRTIADATQLVGVYIALLNNAGQAYSSADISSAYPSQLFDANAAP
jgi:hypothetical protein